jgi:hypothetical protein
MAILCVQLNAVDLGWSRAWLPGLDEETHMVTDGRDLDKPGIYEIKVQGRLDERWSNWFGGMAIAVEGGSDVSPITTLTGVVADQAALRGIVSKIWDLNLALISLNRIEMNSKDNAQLV